MKSLPSLHRGCPFSGFFDAHLRGKALKWRQHDVVDGGITLSALSLIKALFRKPMPGHVLARSWTR